LLPFRNTVVKMTLTGAQLKQVLGRRVLAVSGLKVAWDTSRPALKHMVSATLANGQPLQDTAHYTVAVNDFIAAGGDGLAELLEGSSIEDTGVLLRDMFTSYLKKHLKVSAVMDGRVTIRS
jgi:2',3'-cyclic-nucleotide 2'-phosphodiesterase (5'-nucleotidase family)